MKFSTNLYKTFRRKRGEQIKQIMAFSSLIGLTFVICSDEFDSDFDFNAIYAALNRHLNFLITNTYIRNSVLEIDLSCV